MNIDQPLLWTKYGNLPSAELELQTVWEQTPDYIKCTVNYFRDHELVRNDVYVHSKGGVAATGVAAKFVGV